jgi:hypothetical protein
MSRRFFDVVPSRSTPEPDPAPRGDAKEDFIRAGSDAAGMTDSEYETELERTFEGSRDAADQLTPPAPRADAKDAEIERLRRLLANCEYTFQACRRDTARLVEEARRGITPSSEGIINYADQDVAVIDEMIGHIRAALAPAPPESATPNGDDA